MSEQRQTLTQRSFMRLNQEAFEATAGMHMALLEATALWTTELTAFMARRAQATAHDMVRVAGATTADEVLKAQVDWAQTTLRDCAEETGRMLDIADHAAREGGSGIRSAFLEEGSSTRH